jgi:hypothetical protein
MGVNPHAPTLLACKPLPATLLFCLNSQKHSSYQSVSTVFSYSQSNTRFQSIKLACLRPRHLARASPARFFLTNFLLIWPLAPPGILPVPTKLIR